MSSLIEAKLEEVAELVREAEAKLLTLQFDKTQLEKKNEELERDLALATERLEKDA